MDDNEDGGNVADAPHREGESVSHDGTGPLYMRELFRWAINTVGSAFGWSLFIAFAVALLGALAHEAWLLAISGMAGAVTFALKMSYSSPPWPSEVEVGRADEPRPKPQPEIRPTGIYRRSPGAGE